MISIVIPTIGRDDCISRAIMSAHGTSSRLVKEIIILDNSQSLKFKSYITTEINGLDDDRFSIVFYPERKSMSQSWNGVLEFVKCHWLLYLHDDDELLVANFNQIEEEILEDLEASFISFDYISSNQNKVKEVKRGNFLKEDIPKKIIENCPKFVSTLINVNLLKEINGWSDSYGYFMDTVGFLELYELSTPKFSSLVIGVYYRHKDNASSISNRAIGYGNYIPIVTERCFRILKKKEERRALINLYLNFVYAFEKVPFICRFILKLKNTFCNLY